MKCDDCGKNKPVFFIHKNINGEKIDINLCRECAEKRGISSLSYSNDMTVSDMVGKLLNISIEKEISPDLLCKNCGLTFENFIKIGRLGCQDCYKYFLKELEPILRKLHGNIRHRGKFPKSITFENLQEEIKELKIELKNAIKNEEFERAAEIRDRINILTKIKAK